MILTKPASYKVLSVHALLLVRQRESVTENHLIRGLNLREAMQQFYLNADFSKRPS